ncbi:hypothetical protein J2X31_000200 [Flavobacterium arsenatis]|uniref:Uncharacterized protein n=1 Tax=Flavobacterium arsenatis TaxID=1484332 RepID=A0ABU1TK85_9FLAO|nr:hypothetical protein [Flavobacterium arsenatis]MDR6966207.1 hypothetical protein [Flavobacterium arsenatis]
MKLLFTILLFISHLTLFAQADKVAGDYALTMNTKEGNVLEYKLTLSADGTFFFHHYSNILKGIPPEKNYYGKGKWTVENNLVSFVSDKQTDLDEKHTLDFSNSKARFHTKSAKDKTDRIVKTRLQFLNSEIFWMKRIELLKV